MVIIRPILAKINACHFGAYIAKPLFWRVYCKAIILAQFLQGLSFWRVYCTPTILAQELQVPEFWPNSCKACYFGPILARPLFWRRNCTGITYLNIGPGIASTWILVQELQVPEYWYKNYINKQLINITYIFYSPIW